MKTEINVLAADEKETQKKKIKRRKIRIIILLIIGLCAVEFPGILFAGNRIYPFIFGLPFLYGYVLCGWAYMCIVVFYAYKTEWGRKPFSLKLFQK